MKCPFCDNMIKEAATFCSRCGKKIPRCPTCGIVIRKPLKYCVNDGTAIPEVLLSLFPQSDLSHNDVGEGQQTNLGTRKYCINCGQPCTPGSKYCPACLQRSQNIVDNSQTAFCVECGAPCEEDETLCKKCQQKNTKKAKPAKRVALTLLIILLVIGALSATGYYLYQADMLPAPASAIVQKWLPGGDDIQAIDDSEIPSTENHMEDELSSHGPEEQNPTEPSVSPEPTPAPTELVAAVTVGSRVYSPAEISYLYAEHYYAFTSQYGSYVSILGLDTSNGPFNLGKQDCTMLDGGSWRDYFLNLVHSQLRRTQTLLQYADENGITLTVEEIADLDTKFEEMETYVLTLGYSSLNQYFGTNYGSGVTKALAYQADLDSHLGQKAYTAYRDSLIFTSAQLEEAYTALNGDRDLFDYAYYFVEAEAVEVEAAEPSHAPAEQTLLEAKTTAEAIQAAYRDGSDIDDPAERLNAAIEAEDDSASATVRSGAAGSNLGDLAEWLKDSARKAGEVTVVADSGETGYYVAVFLAREDNHYPTAKVRHILIKAEASEDGTYTEEAKAASLSRAQEILDEYKAGDQTEEAFAALAEQYSEDEGSNAKGGLYENVYQGQMVEAFDAFCFAGHQPGDTGIVYGESGSYAGYHVMYYVGEGELYSNVIAEEDLRSNKMDDWLENADITVIPGAGEALVDPIDGIRISKYTVTVTVKHSDDTAKDFIIHTDASSLREALEQENLIHGEETEFGLYVLSVDGETADQDKEEWWCLTCDGEVMPTGVDDTKIVNGAHYEITLTKGF